MEKKIHHGRNIARFRQMLGLKQDALASIMGDDWTQIKVSRLEAKEEIEPEILNEVAKALKIPAEAIKNFDEEAAIVNIMTNYGEHTGAGSGSFIGSSNSGTFNYAFNPIDKLIEAMDEIKKRSTVFSHLQNTPRAPLENTPLPRRDCEFTPANLRNLYI